MSDYGDKVFTESADYRGTAAFTVSTPLTELIAREEMEMPEGLDEDERAEWMERCVCAFRAVLGAIFQGSSLDPLQIGLTMLTYGYHLQVPSMENMTMEQIGALAVRGRAAICERHKKEVQRKMEAVGQKGHKSPRQKSADVVEQCRKGAKGNRNRRLSVAKKKITRLARNF